MTSERRMPADLVTTWRERADGLDALADKYDGQQFGFPAEWGQRARQLRQCADELEAALRQAEPPTGETPRDPFGDHADGHRAAAELRDIITAIRFAPGQPTGFLHSRFDAENLILKWASKWALARPSDAGDPA